MMKLMNKKLTKKGFTLAELLIVVAILAILVAVSIPIFTSKLHDAKDSTDMANERAAKAAAVVAYMSATDLEAAGETVVYWYDSENGLAIKSADGTKPATITTSGYNQCSKTGCTKGAGQTANTKYVKVTIAENGTKVTSEWAS